MAVTVNRPPRLYDFDVVTCVKVLDEVGVAIGEHTRNSALCQSLEEGMKAYLVIQAEPARLVACEGRIIRGVEVNEVACRKAIASILEVSIGNRGVL